ncbi:MAG TPA: error-prone DNA polymerase [Chthoniobacteraceae bacterium]|jgi:error-prone DNA polymerase|nr:error-prone DNA polymerase [Chthoniobacteraceae bacterium]
MNSTGYCELHARSACNFLRGASTPEHLAEAAAMLGIPAVAVHDRDGVYGAPRFHARARELGVRPIIGCELTLEDGGILPVIVLTRGGYQNLCKLITVGKLRGTKTECSVTWAELARHTEGLAALTGDEEGHLRRLLAGEDAGAPPAFLRKLAGIFGRGNVYLEIQRHFLRGERVYNRRLIALAAQTGLPLLATNGVCYAAPQGRQVLDVFTCIRHHTSLDLAGTLLSPNDQRHLKDAAAMEALFADVPEAVSNTLLLAARVEFSLENLGYHFPTYRGMDAAAMAAMLREQTYAGARNRFSALDQKVRAQLEHELDLIIRLGIAGYFLIVWDIVRYCHEHHIMVQGRGSAANSAVCFSLGITYCDPLKYRLLFERFLTENRKGAWPDIDLDLPSGDKREQVIQEVYKRYGRTGAAMTANVITYRGRSAMREVGKALGLSPDVMDRFSDLYANGDFPHTIGLEDQLGMAGVAATHPRWRAVCGLFQAIYGLPRHLGQHSGGMIIFEGRLDSIVPLENASMPGRVVAQWDKDDCEDLGIIKVDFLGLGMMAVIQDTVELSARRGRPVDLAQLPEKDPATFEMIRAADTIGVFQIESRAQMATLPRMKPESFYDLVIEVAIIRPGPIQGNLTHPYLRRRRGEEPVTYYHPDVMEVLERTLGVPLFQEQMLKIAMVLADFTGAEADELRRALGFHRSEEKMARVQVKLRSALARKGHKPEVIEQVVAAVTSFALYGFPESHAISFAHLAYGSAYLKAHRAPEFYASLLNNQPMGFYSGATLIMDAKRRGIKFHSVDIVHSGWLCAVNPDDSIRLGFCVVEGFSAGPAGQLLEERARTPFHSLPDLRRRVPLSMRVLRTLAGIGALESLEPGRRQALWNVLESHDTDDLFQAPAEAPAFPAMTAGEELEADYEGMRLSVARHGMELVRPELEGVLRAADLPARQNGEYVTVAGAVICRQRPGTAKGFVFVSLEDETGISNAVVEPRFFERHRRLITGEPFLMISGRLQNVEGVIHIRAAHIEPLETGNRCSADSHDFR